MDALVFRQLLGGRQLVGAGIEFGVPQRALDGFLIVGEDAFDPFIVEEAWAVDIFVEHARGEVVGEFFKERHEGLQWEKLFRRQTTTQGALMGE